MFSPTVQKLIDELSKLPGHRAQDGPAPHLPPAQAPSRGRPAPGPGAHRRQGDGALLRPLLQPHRAGAVRLSASTPDGTPTTICVVEEPGDIISIERTHEYRGLYHVLGGALSPLDGIGPQKLHLAELFEPGPGRGDPRGHRGHQPQHGRRGHRPLHRRGAPRLHGRRHPAHHPPGGRAAHGRRPGVRRRGHPRPGAHRAARAL